MKRTALYLFILMIGPICCRAQEPLDITVLEDSLMLDSGVIDTFQSISKLNPQRSAFLSAVVPGLGQIYNKQYWKLPIIYGGGILLAHLVKYNADFYNAFRNAYIAETDDDETTINPFSNYGESALERRTEQFDRDRNFMIILGAALYLLNIVDAHVSTHLMEFEINDDLSFRPSYHSQSKYTTQSMGVSLVFQLSK